MFFETKAYLKHILKAKGPHGVHSPLVFDLITKVLVQRKSFYIFDTIEMERAAFLNSCDVLDVNDHGAGSRKMKGHQRGVAEIARYSLQSAHHAQALFKLLHHFHPENILELGTSLGITTSYFASVSSNSKVWTIEGSDQIGHVAEQLFQRLQLWNVRLQIGTFDSKLPGVLNEMGRVDCAFIDGHHEYQPTMRYYHQIRKHSHENTLIILDDIHWSASMEKAWNEIIHDVDVTLSLDFYHFGVLLFAKDRVKEHFRLKLP